MASDVDLALLTQVGIDINKLVGGWHPHLYNLDFSNHIMITLYKISEYSAVTVRTWLYRLAGISDIDENTALIPKGNLSKKLVALRKKLASLSKDKHLDERDALHKDKLVTGPLWRISELDDLQIMDMSGQFKILITWLGANVLDPSAFLEGSGPQLASQPNPAVILEARITPAEIDEHLLIVAKQVMLIALQFFTVNVKEFLDGAAQRITPDDPDPLQIRHKKINHRYEENGKERWWPDAAFYYQCQTACYMGGTLSLWSNQAEDSDEWETDPDERGPSSKGNRGRKTTKKRGKRRHSRDSSNSSASQDAPPRKRRRKKLHTAEYIYERLFLGGENADVTISALGRKWNLHKVYLKQSLFFAGMFSGDWSESNQQEIDIQVVDDAVTPEALDRVLASLYRDEIEIDAENVVSIVAAASLLQLESVLQRCSETMADNIKRENVLLAVETSEKYGLELLKKSCVSFLEENFCSLANEVSFLKNLSQELLAQMLSSPNLLVIEGEIDLYNIVKRWIYLSLNPGCSLEQKALAEASNQFIDKARGDSALNLAKKFASVLRPLRLQHIVTSKRTVDVLLADQLIPKNVLNAVLSNQWRALLASEESIESGEMRKSDFSAQAMRCGRVVDIAPKCWRWSGFNFGVDILLRFNHGVITLKRNCLSQTCPYSINIKHHVDVYYRIIVRAPQSKNWSVDSGLKKVTLKTDEVCNFFV
uniref:BTB domain-containing protein n=1 Tax=Plectus sambesii TaxID=2011161 RepID=A0A914WTS9_9BILA